LGLLSPLVAAGLGAVVAGEELTSMQIAGFALALVAMVAGQLVPSRREPVIGRVAAASHTGVDRIRSSGRRHQGGSP
ncbi:MAG: hypothetical protein ACTIH8_01075, partial [Microbacterium gubbeenense]